MGRVPLKRFAVVAALAILAVACSDPVDDSLNADDQRVLSIVAGNSQTVTVGEFVPITPKVMVADENGAPLANVTVRFKPGVSSGMVVTGTVLTKSDGTAQPDAWRASSVPGTNTLVATVDGAKPGSVTFTATGVAAGSSPR